MKLAQGEYVALEKIENLYNGAPIVGQLYVHGDSLQAFLVAVVIPDPVQLAALASATTGVKVDPADRAALEKAIKDPKINAAILAILTKEAKRNGLKGYAQPITSKPAISLLTSYT
jgi:long-chain acyl-CoA synthetase